MSGWELCAILRRQSATREIPMLFLTGRTEVKDRITAMQVGGSDYLAKPFGAGGSAPQGQLAPASPGPPGRTDETETTGRAPSG